MSHKDVDSFEYHNCENYYVPSNSKDKNVEVKEKTRRKTSTFFHMYVMKNVIPLTNNMKK